MSGIHTTHGADARHGLPVSTRARPLPDASRMTRGARARLWASILAIYALAALAIAAPTVTLTLLLAGIVIGAMTWGVFQLADRGRRRGTP